MHHIIFKRPIFDELKRISKNKKCYQSYFREKCGPPSCGGPDSCRCCPCLNPALKLCGYALGFSCEEESGQLLLPSQSVGQESNLPVRRSVYHVNKPTQKNDSICVPCMTSWSADVMLSIIGLSLSVSALDR